MLNAYARGLYAYLKGVHLDENPFPADNDDHALWQRGWLASQTAQHRKGR